MANLTVSIDDDVLRTARIRALEQGTSVNALIREFLDGYAGVDRRRAATRAFIDTASNSKAGSGGRRWTRDELHDRASIR